MAKSLWTASRTHRLTTFRHLQGKHWLLQQAQIRTNTIPFRSSAMSSVKLCRHNQEGIAIWLSATKRCHRKYLQYGQDRAAEIPCILARVLLGLIYCQTAWPQVRLMIWKYSMRLKKVVVGAAARSTDVKTLRRGLAKALASSSIVIVRFASFASNSW